MTTTDLHWLGTGTAATTSVMLNRLIFSIFFRVVGKESRSARLSCWDPLPPPMSSLLSLRTADRAGRFCLSCRDGPDVIAAFLGCVTNSGAHHSAWRLTLTKSKATFLRRDGG